MRPVSDGSLAAIVPQNPRSGGPADADQFSAHLPRARPPAQAADKSKASGLDKDSSGKAEDVGTSDTPTDQTQSDGMQWLAAQMLAFKMKEPVQTVAPDGSVATTIKTSIVTLPSSALAQGTATADGVPTLDPQTGLLVMKPVPTGAPGTPPVAGDLPAAPGDAPPTDALPTDPAATPAPDAPGAGAAVPPAQPGAQDPTAVAGTPPADPTTVDPTASDPALVDPVLPTDLQPVDASGTVPSDGDPAGDPATPGAGQAKSALTAAGAQLGFGRASTVSSGNAGGGSGGSSSGNSQDPNGGADMQLAKATQAASSVGFTAPSVQIQLAVPADRQLAPSLGAELASTAQGMSALERVLQASDQAQASTPVMKVLNVQLAPPDLGNVSMRLALQGNSLEVHMSVDQGRTRTLIERDRHVIADSLSKVGYAVSTLTVEHTSASNQSNMSSAGQSFTSNSGYDGSSGRQSNGAGGFGSSQGRSGQGQAFTDGDIGAPVASSRLATNSGLFI